MPGSKSPGPSVKDDKTYEALRDDGASKEKAARIANAKAAYAWYQEFIASARWKALAAKGAQPQRLLWASTGVKDKAYPSTLYVDSLSGQDTVNTMTPETMDAFRDSGTVKPTLTDDVAGAHHVLDEAERLGLDLTAVTDTLVEEGVARFAKSFDALLAAIAKKQPATA